jgi:hypothetical protein
VEIVLEVVDCNRGRHYTMSQSWVVLGKDRTLGKDMDMGADMVLDMKDGTLSELYKQVVAQRRQERSD